MIAYVECLSIRNLFSRKDYTEMPLGRQGKRTHNVVLDWIAVLRLFRDIGWDKLGAGLFERNFAFYD